MTNIKLLTTFKPDLLKYEHLRLLSTIKVGLYYTHYLARKISVTDFKTKKFEWHDIHFL